MPWVMGYVQVEAFSPYLWDKDRLWVRGPASFVCSPRWR